jgi:hypothetical protein
MMETKLEREVRFLKAYAVVATLLCAVFVLTAFTMQSRKQKFEEIDVERINIVEKDGQVKLVISNKERLPGPGDIVKGELGTRQGLKTPGMLFYNEKGDECGGLIFGSREQDGKYAAATALLFDKYNGDQVMGMRVEDVGGGRRTVGLNVWDQPDVSPEEQHKNYDEAAKLSDGPEKDALRQQAVAHQRMFIGRTSDKQARIVLSDANGRPRIRLSVEQNGEAKLEFLDRSGKVTQTLPTPSSTPNK